MFSDKMTYDCKSLVLYTSLCANISTYYLHLFALTI